MYALTVWQPWAWAIGAGIKTIENRDWLPNWRLLKDGDDIAIHASVRSPTRYDMEAVREQAAAGGHHVPASDSHELGPAYGRGVIVAVATFAGIARAPGELTPEQRPWWVGKYGWLLSNVRQLQLGSRPKVLGQQGLWTLPPDTERMVRGQLATTGPGALWRKTA